MKWGRPGSIHHLSGREVDVGGEGPISKNIRTKLESEFLTGQDDYHVKVWSLKRGEALERMILCIVLAVGTYVHLVST